MVARRVGVMVSIIVILVLAILVRLFIYSGIYNGGDLPRQGSRRVGAEHDYGPSVSATPKA